MTQKFNNFKSCNPREISIPSNLSADEIEVQKVISSFNADGTIPDIIITEDGELIEGINSLMAAIKLGQEIIPTIYTPSKTPQIDIKWIPVELIDPHPINAQIYGENEDVTALAESIAINGLQEIFTLKPDGDRYTIIHGHRRRLACLKAGIKVVPARLKNFSTLKDEITALLAGNEYREKTIEQKVREGLMWEEIEREEAKLRMGRAGLGEGTVRDRIAKKVGLGSGVNYEHAAAAVREMDGSKDAPVGSVQHHRHQQFKQLLSKPWGVDAAYKLIKPEPPPNQTKRWMPKEFERVRIIAGPRKGAIAVVRIVTGLSTICYIEGDPEHKRHQIAFNQMEQMEQMEAITEIAPATSVKDELKQKQNELGLKGRSQLLPDKDRNEGFDTSQQPTLMVTLTTDEIIVAETADKLLKLSSKQLYQVMCKVQPDLDTAQLEAIWKALEKSLAHKAA